MGGGAASVNDNTETKLCSRLFGGVGNALEKLKPDPSGGLVYRIIVQRLYKRRTAERTDRCKPTRLWLNK